MCGFDSAQRAYDAALPIEGGVITGPDDGRDVLDTREIDGIEYRVYLEPDSDCESPRGYDSNVGVIVTVGGPRNPYYAWPAEDGDVIAAQYVRYGMEERSFRAVARWLRMSYGASVVLPLYSTGGDGRPAAGEITDAPDVGDYIGVTFDQPSSRERTGLTDAAEIELALSVDVAEYSAWARGDCFGYVIERATEDGADWEQTDSCWGYIGDDYARTEARRALSDL